MKVSFFETGRYPVTPDTMLPGRFVFGLLRGTTNEYLSYDLNPKEARERTDEGMELILKAWTEPQPFGWQGRYFQYRTVSIWPQPQEQPHRPTYALGVSAEAADFAARHRLGLGVSYGTFELMAKSTGYYRQRCAEYGWEPGPDDIIRSEEHTSELQSHVNLVCRLLLEKKK